MNEVILRVAARTLLPLLGLASVFILLGGHDAPGGGFAGGLVAACAFALHSLAYGVDEARRLLHVDPSLLMASGLLCAVISACVGPLAGKAFLAGVWFEVGTVEVGTPLLFEAGVFLVVLGAALSMLWTLQEAD